MSHQVPEPPLEPAPEARYEAVSIHDVLHDLALAIERYGDLAGAKVEQVEEIVSASRTTYPAPRALRVTLANRSQVTLWLEVR